MFRSCVRTVTLVLDSVFLICYYYACFAVLAESGVPSVLPRGQGLCSLRPYGVVPGLRGAEAQGVHAEVRLLHGYGGTVREVVLAGMRPHRDTRNVHDLLCGTLPAERVPLHAARF